MRGEYGKPLFSVVPQCPIYFNRGQFGNLLTLLSGNLFDLIAELFDRDDNSGTDLNLLF